MSLRTKIALALGATALFLAAGLAMHQAQKSLDRINPRPARPLESARLWRTQPSDGPAPATRESTGRPFDWKVVPFIVLGVGAMIAVVGTMAFVLGRAMPDALDASDTDDLAAGDAASISGPRE